MDYDKPFRKVNKTKVKREAIKRLNEILKEVRKELYERVGI